jgi:hypothetical protein
VESAIDILDKLISLDEASFSIVTQYFDESLLLPKIQLALEDLLPQ